MPNEITAIIIDDEAGNIELLTGLLNTHCSWVSITGSCNNIEKGIEMIQECEPNILFLDIRMPKGSGFELLDRLNGSYKKMQVIFTTAFDEYAVRAFRYSAQDYLLKPIHPKQIIESVTRASNEKERTDQFERINHIGAMLQIKENAIPSIILRTLTGQVKVFINDIIRCEADGNYTLIFLKETPRIVATKSLKEFDKLLSPFNFLRVHQSHLISLSEFTGYTRNKDTGGGQVALKNGDRVEVSRSKKKILLQTIKESNTRK
ncbi:MAG: two-component system LytT family response regulator [Crocinitomix sp.]|jgi:two-component system LytT family response regulator